MPFGARTDSHNRRGAVGVVKHFQSEKFDTESLGKGWICLPIAPYIVQNYAGIEKPHH